MFVAIIVTATIFGFQAISSIDKKITQDTYNVSGLSRDSLVGEFRRENPRGYAATTNWWVEWDWKCRVTYYATVKFPEHSDLAALSIVHRNDWARFITKLKLHEYTHVKHGESAAQEVKESMCFGAEKIIRYWRLKDKHFDVSTKNGTTEGVFLNIQ